MKDANAIILTAKKTILLESNAIANLANLLDSLFVAAVNFIFNSKELIIAHKIGGKINIVIQSNLISVEKEDVNIVHLHDLIKEGIF